MKIMLAVFTLVALLCISEGSIAGTPLGYTGRVSVESKAVMPGESFTVKIWLGGNNLAITSLRIPLKLSGSYVTCNYVDFTGSLKASNMEGFYRVNGSEIEFSYIPPVVFPLPTITADSGLIATLYFTASPGAPSTIVSIDSVYSDSLIQSGGSTYHIWTRIEFSDDIGLLTILPDYKSGSVDIRHATDIAEREDLALPKSLELDQNYPNPFNPTTTVIFALPQKSMVRLEVYNILGQKMVTLADQEFLAGTHAVTWDASSAPSGIYFYRLAVGTQILTRKMLLMK